MLRRVLDLGLEHLGERRQHRARRHVLRVVGVAPLRDLEADGDLALHRLARLAEEARRARVDVGHVDLLVLAPEPLDVGELEAEREQRGEVLVEGFLVERVLGERLLLDGWSLCLVAHGFECV